MHYAKTTWDSLAAIRAKRPLVVNVTNNVVTNLTANALLALGASPAMSHAAPDAAELAGFAGALVCNMGTPQQAYVDSMLAAGKAACERGVPVIFDPVAVGATAYRVSLGREFLSEVRPAVLRGNASEILSLAGLAGSSKGADSGDEAGAAIPGAKELAARLGCVVCVSGAEDFVTDGKTLLAVGNGVPMMTLVTGLGCTATALVGAFCAVCPDHLAATVQAMAVMGLAGEIAGRGDPGPGTFAVRFIDALYAIGQGEIEAGLKVREL